AEWVMIAEKVPTEEPVDGRAKAGKQPSDARLDDFILLGRYSLILCCLSEALILSQLGNMFFMMYAGVAPTLVSCGDASLSGYKDDYDACAALEQLQAETNCTPSFSTQFESVNYETMLVALISTIACMFASSFTYDLLWFTIMRFLVNFFTGGTMVILVVFMVENLPSKDRFWIQNLITWSPNIVLFAIVAYLAGDWRTLTRASAMLALPAVGLLMFICESPQSLVQRRRLVEAKDAIQRIYRINGHNLDEDLLDQVLDKEAKKFLQLKAKVKQYTFVHLFYTWRFTRYTVAVAFSLFVASILNYSLLFNMEKLSGSIYMNAVYMGL
ncbi:Protein Y51A2D.18, partial [Aphelenchoides avenae]